MSILFVPGFPGEGTCLWMVHQDYSTVMPCMDGLILRDLILREFPDIRVLLATGHGRESEDDEPGPPGAQNILLKPFDIDVLIDRINQPPDK